MAKDKIPTSRVGRTAKIGGLAAGQAIRQAGTRAANVARTKEGRQAALALLSGDKAKRAVTRIPATLIVRDSTAKVRGG